jgi:hypothetical protein
VFGDQPFCYTPGESRVDVLAAIGRRDEARSLFIDLAHQNAFRLLSKGIHPETGSLWGIPQSYSMASIVNSAMRLSVKWEDVWRRG